MPDKKAIPFPVVIFWADEEQFAINKPKVNKGFVPPSVEHVAGFVEDMVDLLEERFGPDWWDCNMLKAICKAAGLPVSDKVPIHDNFRRVDVP